MENILRSKQSTIEQNLTQELTFDLQPFYPYK